MSDIFLKAPKGATKKRKRLGRGIGSGRGKTAGKGHKGQNARSGGGVRPGFEGGQMPLFRRVARRGFSNYLFKIVYAVVNLEDLTAFDDGEKVTKETLVQKGLVTKRCGLVKILGKGEITKKLDIEIDKVSESAREKIIKAGGTVKELKTPKPKLVKKKKMKMKKGKN
jgi:large subunit ribosomal protein L15